MHACASTRRCSQSRPFSETADELFATLFVRGGLWGAQQLRACSASLPETHGGSARLLIAASRRPEIEQHSQREMDDTTRQPNENKKSGAAAAKLLAGASIHKFCAAAEATRDVNSSTRVRCVRGYHEVKGEVKLTLKIYICILLAFMPILMKINRDGIFRR